MTTSSLRTKSSLEMAAAAVAVVRVTMPVLETSEFPGRASRRALALAAGAGVVDWKRTLDTRRARDEGGQLGREEEEREGKEGRDGPSEGTGLNSLTSGTGSNGAEHLWGWN
jgi:hypothetical protein